MIAAHWRQIAGDGLRRRRREGLAGIVDFFVEHGRLVRAVSEASATDAAIEQGYSGLLAAFTDIIEHGLDELVDRGPARGSQHARTLARR